jgi:hypothetical protein
MNEDIPVHLSFVALYSTPRKSEENFLKINPELTKWLLFEKTYSPPGILTYILELIWTVISMSIMNGHHTLKNLSWKWFGHQ